MYQIRVTVQRVSTIITAAATACCNALFKPCALLGNTGVILPKPTQSLFYQVLSYQVVCTGGSPEAAAAGVIITAGH
jgi:hypothetical protein